MVFLLGLNCICCAEAHDGLVRQTIFAPEKSQHTQASQNIRQLSTINEHI